MKVKKFIIILFIIAIIVSALLIHVSATSIPKLTIEPSVTEAHPGDEITYTVKMSAIQNLAGMKFKLVIPDGLTFVDGKEIDGNIIPFNSNDKEVNVEVYL